MTEDVTPGELTRWLGRVEKKLDDNLKDHEERLRTLEHRSVVTPRHIYVASGLGCTALGVIIAALTLVVQIVNA